MSGILYLIPIALFLGLVGLTAFLWALRSGQFDDLDGAAHRILLDDDQPIPPRPPAESEGPATKRAAGWAICGQSRAPPTNPLKTCRYPRRVSS